jgi:holliday junction DNA helicase RuvA
VIGYLSGRVGGLTGESCFLDVGGVGYRVACSATTLAALPSDGENFRLWTYMHVREDAISLFGFASEAEQQMFEALLGVSGVGPKVALQVCSAFTPDNFRRTLATDDVAAIAGVPGIGKKTAQRILLELKERLSVPDLRPAGTGPDVLGLARSALENLGYSAGEVREALAQTRASGDDGVQDVIKSALRVLA